MPMAYFGKEFRFAQPDGKEVVLEGWVSQDHAVFEDPAGYRVIKDPLSGYYVYAKLSADKSSLESTGAKLGVTNPKTLGLEKHLRVTKKESGGKFRAAPSPLKKKTRWEERREVSQKAKRKAMKAKGVYRAPPAKETKGDYKGLCILIQFPDEEGTISKEEVEEFCNKKGYKGYGNNGSVYGLFYDVSCGKLRYTTIVTAYYTAKKSKGYYTDPGITYGDRAIELIEEALADLKSGEFDFSTLSTDDEGYIYALNAFYAGSCDNEWGQGLWPHSYGLESSFEVGDGRKLRDYQITNMGDELSLATYCHENGHMVCSFPDLYDYAEDYKQSCGVGHFCLMCFGGEDQKNPTQVCAYLKYAAGWADKVTSLTEGTHTIKADKNDFFIYPKNPAEYFIIENRFQEKRDSTLPGSGLAIFHVDETGSNENQGMTEESHYECALEQADGRFHLERYQNAGDAKDLYASPGTFADDTHPDSTWWDGKNSGLAISGISKPGKTMSFTMGNAVIANEIILQESPKIKIPDNDPDGITQILTNSVSGKVKEIEVSVDIKHSKIGNLVVTLISPRGIAIDLHQRTGGDKDNLKETYTMDSVPELKNLTGKSIKGAWRLKVADLGKRNIGKLNHWEVKITPK